MVGRRQGTDSPTVSLGVLMALLGDDGRTALNYSQSSAWCATTFTRGLSGEESRVPVASSYPFRVFSYRLVQTDCAPYSLVKAFRTEPGTGRGRSVLRRRAVGRASPQQGAPSRVQWSSSPVRRRMRGLRPARRDPSPRGASPCSDSRRPSA